jgi:peptidoglycan/LPS O-acetylase OafA/YrhL
LALMVIGVVAAALSVGRRSLITWSLLGGLLTIGAGFNGASFLDYHKDVSSFIMTVLALASVLCFLVIVYVTSGTGSNDTTRPTPAMPVGTS